jgi:hypothetical protein
MSEWNTAWLRRLLLGGLGALAGLGEARGQRAQLSQCSQLVTADSVVLFFNPRYELTPTECAAIRRQTRLSAEGKLYGPVRDFRVSNNRLLVQATYQAGLLHGPCEMYYSSGQLAVRGQYEQGARRGDWDYWYPSGQTQQQLRFPTDGRVRIMAYWDSTGRQLVTNGQGLWQGRGSRGFRSTGKVRLGLPDGQWRGSYVQDKQRYTAVELYERGEFRKGRWNDGGRRRDVPYFEPMLQPLVTNAVEQAGALRLGFSCDEQARRQQFALLKEHLRVPTVAMGLQHYAERLSQRMVRHSDAPWYRALPPKVKVRCSLDATGRFTTFETESPALQRVVQRLLTDILPPWQPARFQGDPVPGYVDLELNTSTRIITVRPAARLSPDQVPAVPAPDLL